MASIFSVLRGGAGVQAAVLVPPPLPKAPKGPQSLPGYRTNVAARSSAIPKSTVETTTLDRISNLRNQGTPYAVLREIYRYSPEVGAAITMTLRTAIPEEYVVVARDLDGQIDPAGTAVAHELLRRLTFLGAADGSFGAQQGVQSLAETSCLDLILTGGAALEVALDKSRVPASFNSVSVSSLTFYEEDNSFRVTQKIGGTEIDLDLPTFIYASLDQVGTEAYPTSPLHSSIQPVMADLEFTDNTRKALKRAVLPRLVAAIDSAKVHEQTPPEVKADPEKLMKYRNELLAQVQGVIDGLQPEDALVSYDFVNYSYVQGGHDPSTIIERVQKVLNAKLVSGAKALPVTLGFASTNGASSAESLLFLKYCDGYRKKLNEMYSRALTVALRLMGVDGYVEFNFEKLNLRPDTELEAFRAMKQSRLLELLSLGMISDAECSLQLTGRLPPAGAPVLSGTMFTAKKASTENPESNTANGTEKDLSPDTPTTPKSK